MIALAEHAEGVILPVRAQPGARKVGVQGEQNGALKLAVSAPPEDGKANQALVDLLRDLLKLKRSQVELFSGHTGREKRFLLRGVTVEEVKERVATILNRVP